MAALNSGVNLFCSLSFCILHPWSGKPPLCLDWSAVRTGTKLCPHGCTHSPEPGLAAQPSCSLLGTVAPSQCGWVHASAPLSLAPQQGRQSGHREMGLVFAVVCPRALCPIAVLFVVLGTSAAAALRCPVATLCSASLLPALAAVAGELI